MVEKPMTTEFQLRSLRAATLLHKILSATTTTILLWNLLSLALVVVEKRKLLLVDDVS
jgi:hypothetical protein